MENEQNKSTVTTIPADPYTLVDYVVAKRAAHEGYPVDYSVRCPDGTVLVFANEGDGGPDYLKGRKAGRKILPPNAEDRKREDALAAWCAAQPTNTAFDAEIGEAKRGPTTDRHTAIWAEDAAVELQFQKDVARTAKRTVCWTTPDAPRTLRFLQLPRGTTATPEWRKGAAEHIAKKYPGATVWGGAS